MSESNGWIRTETYGETYLQWGYDYKLRWRPYGNNWTLLIDGSRDLVWCYDDGISQMLEDQILPEPRLCDLDWVRSTTNKVKRVGEGDGRN